MNAVFYPAIFHPEETGYSVSVPDIENCFTQGETMDEAVAMAQDAIGDFIAMVPFDMEEYQKQFKPVKKTLSIPGWLNDAAESAHINFSSVLQKGLKSELGMI